jgi:hypothetical protein
MSGLCWMRPWPEWDTDYTYVKLKKHTNSAGKSIPALFLQQYAPSVFSCLSTSYRVNVSFTVRKLGRIHAPAFRAYRSSSRCVRAP